jgi:hypothetical protein
MTAMSEPGADAFGHLQDLLARVPGMTEKGDTLTKAKDARLLLRLQAELAAVEVEWWQLQEAVATAQAAYQEALGEGDERAQSHLATIRYWEEIVAVRRAPYRRAKTALDEALAASALTLDDSLTSIALDDEEFCELEAEVDGFKQDYAATLEACRQIECH